MFGRDRGDIDGMGLGFGRIAYILAVLLLWAVHPCIAQELDQWSHSRSVTIYNSSGSSWIDIPVGIRLEIDNFDFGAANADGADLRFISAGTDTFLHLCLPINPSVTIVAR